MTTCPYCIQPLSPETLSLWAEIDTRYSKLDPDCQLHAVISDKMPATEDRWCLPECSEARAIESEGPYNWFPPMQWLNAYAVEWIRTELTHRVIERANKPLEYLIQDRPSSLLERLVRPSRTLDLELEMDIWESLSFWAKVQDLSEWYWDCDAPLTDSDDEYFTLLLSKPKPDDFGNATARRHLQAIWNDFKHQALYDLQLKAEEYED